MTKNGNDTLLPAEENCSDLVGIPNSLEVNHAFTRKISHTFSVVSRVANSHALRAYCFLDEAASTDKG